MGGAQSWKAVTRSIMELYAQRTQGTYIEENESAVVWQYRDADPEFGLMQVQATPPPATSLVVVVLDDDALTHCLTTPPSSSRHSPRRRLARA